MAMEMTDLGNFRDPPAPGRLVKRLVRAASDLCVRSVDRLQERAGLKGRSHGDAHPTAARCTGRRHSALGGLPPISRLSTAGVSRYT